MKVKLLWNRTEKGNDILLPEVQRIPRREKIPGTILPKYKYIV